MRAKDTRGSADTTQPGSSSTESSARSSSTSERREELLRIAAELFAERGYKATTVRAIGEAAGVLSGSLYHHFDSKEAMADELLATYFDALLDRYYAIIDSGRPPLETFREMVYAAFDTIEQHRAATRTLQNEGRYFATLPRFAYLKDRERTIEELWIGIIKSGKASGAIRSNLDPRTVYRFARDGIWVAARWYKPTGKLTHRDLADQFLTILLAGIAAPTTE